MSHSVGRQNSNKSHAKTRIKSKYVGTELFVSQFIMMDIQLIHTIDTEYSADSVEWCPHPDFKNLFVCGTYQLKESSEENHDATMAACHRKGRIYLYKFDESDRSLLELNRVETAAILDMRWLKTTSNVFPILATATALGNVEVYIVEELKLKCVQVFRLNPSDNNLLTLSLDWGLSADEANISEGKQNQLLTSDSKGNISLAAWSSERNLEMIRSWHAHEFEAWICAFDKWDKNLVYTGGDDTFLHVYDLRSETRSMVNKSHNAGVTCLLSHPKREKILLTGSYDEKLRTFDTRTMKTPLSELDLQGGIWRIKSDPVKHDLMLCACMYHNFSIVDLCNVYSPSLVGKFEEHESICYGADWSTNVDDNFYMATCSFYDHKLCISSVNPSLK
uniref:methylated diphthine methylhydrolase n=2 Tax=Stomoxys calcitrans TaxID=35570 RepID=A0A1I8PQF6_STOCA